MFLLQKIITNALKTDSFFKICLNWWTEVSTVLELDSVSVEPMLSPV
jgi:hypothetical protein